MSGSSNSTSMPAAAEDSLVGHDDDNNIDYEVWMIALNSTVAILSTIMCGVGIFFMVAIFKLRKFTFNLYIIFAILPDAMCNGILGISLFAEATSKGSMPLFLCEWMCFHLLFYYLSNLYVNAVIAHEVLGLVQNSFHRRRTQPPSTTKVMVQVGGIYGLMGLLSGWFVAPLPWSIMTIDNDPICVSRFKHVVGGLATNVLLSLPPFLYTFGVAYFIHTHKLLPLKGRTRVLALYFLRIIVIFVAFYAPILVLATYGFVVAPNPGEDVNTLYFVSLQVLKLLFPIQNVVTFSYLLQKDDIYHAVWQHVATITRCCGSISHQHNQNRLDPNAPTNNHPPDQPQTMSEWFMDDVYESDTAPSTTISETITGGVVVATTNHNHRRISKDDIECSIEIAFQDCFEEGEIEAPSNESIHIFHPTLDDEEEEVEEESNPGNSSRKCLRKVSFVRKA